MTLTDAQIERYSRQLLLREIGGRGQMRLLAATVVVEGTGDAAATAATLLGRAGVGALVASGTASALPELSPDCRVGAEGDRAAADVVVDLGSAAPTAGARVENARFVVVGRQRADRAVLALLVGRPCAACLPAGAYALPAGDETPLLAVPTALALGALAASETLMALLAPPPRGRLHHLAPADGRFEALALPQATCARCRTLP
jgi:hypothetical protein